MRFVQATVAPVKKNLMAAAALVDAGNVVVLAFENIATKERVEIERRGDTFEVDFMVEPYALMPAAPRKGPSRG